MPWRLALGDVDEVIEQFDWSCVVRADDLVRPRRRGPGAIAPLDAGGNEAREQQGGSWKRQMKTAMVST